MAFADHDGMEALPCRLAHQTLLLQLVADLHDGVGLFGAGREKRIYAIPPYTKVKSLDFEDHPFEVQRWSSCCALCGAKDSFLDEIVTDDRGGRMFVCSDTDYCTKRRAAGEVGPQGQPQAEGAEA